MAVHSARVIKLDELQRVCSVPKSLCRRTVAKARQIIAPHYCCGSPRFFKFSYQFLRLSYDSEINSPAN
jgi:hypothetical protein